jgi:hypothetical protein
MARETWQTSRFRLLEYNALNALFPLRLNDLENINSPNLPRLTSSVFHKNGTIEQESAARIAILF